MYNRIVLKVPPICPQCGKEMREETEDGEWQSKDTEVNGVDQELEMETYKLEDMTAGEFHGGCEHCDSFVEFHVRNGEIINSELR